MKDLGAHLNWLGRLRDIGVKAARLDTDGQALEVEFFPVANALIPDIAPQIPKDFGKPQTCKCGHSEDEHGPEGLCYQGCSEDKCMEPETKP